MKKIISLIILSLFTYNTIGFLAVHPFLSIYYKHRGRRRAEISSEEVKQECLIFNKEDIEKGKINFSWINSREFRYNGDMYDIIEKEETDSELIVNCINDTKEKKFEEEFVKNVSRMSSNNKHRSKVNSYKRVSLSEPVKLSREDSFISFNKCLHIFSYGYYKSIFLETPTPPPKSLSII